MPYLSLVKQLMPTLAGHKVFSYVEQGMVVTEVLQQTEVTEQRVPQEATVRMDRTQVKEPQEAIMEAQEVQEEISFFKMKDLCNYRITDRLADLVYDELG